MFSKAACWCREKKLVLHVFVSLAERKQKGIKKKNKETGWFACISDSPTAHKEHCKNWKHTQSFNPISILDADYGKLLLQLNEENKKINQLWAWRTFDEVTLLWCCWDCNFACKRCCCCICSNCCSLKAKLIPLCEFPVLSWPKSPSPMICDPLGMWWRSRE